MVYNYTKPRAPIAAMYSSPGPCYALPGLVGQKTHDPRSEHNKGPAYPFGVRHGKFKDDCSPGPCYYPSPKYSRTGPDGVPHYSLYSRQRDGTMFKTPGPGAYSPEHAGPTAHYRHPAYIFGIRHRNKRTDNTPAPNNYTLPYMIGKTVQSDKKQAPCYSLSGRSNVGSFCEDLAKVMGEALKLKIRSLIIFVKHEDPIRSVAQSFKVQTPGPGTYNTTEPQLYRDKAPQYSMTSRNVMPGDTTQKPGPGAHSPEIVTIHKRQAPSYSFGIRHSQYMAPLIIDCKD